MVKSWSLLILAGILFVLLGIGLVWCAVRLIQGNRGDTLVTAPLVPEQTIQLPAGADVVVLVQVPQLATDFKNVQLELIDKESERSMVMKYSYASSQGAVHGFDGVKLRFGQLTVSGAGGYIARISGLAPGKDYSRYQLIFSRPYLGRMTVQIIGIVFCGVGMLGCLIWGVWLCGWMKQRG
jgi:hypothetical protein